MRNALCFALVFIAQSYFQTQNTTALLCAIIFAIVSRETLCFCLSANIISAIKFIDVSTNFIPVITKTDFFLTISNINAKISL